MKESHAVTADLPTLAKLFYASPDQLGTFERVAAEAMPRRFRELLAHDNHMTVTVESFHDSPVDVQVLEKQISPKAYARKILLTRQSDGSVVQYGIMRVLKAHLSEAVRRDIESEAVPLGRILIEHNLLRQVELVALWKVTPGDELQQLLLMEPEDITYGRTALIHVAGEPAVQLLEIVTPR
ncbi:MAG: hypothetical protein WDZ59_12360 [Pirellulales bacterium]